MHGLAAITLLVFAFEKKFSLSLQPSGHKPYAPNPETPRLLLLKPYSPARPEAKPPPKKNQARQDITQILRPRRLNPKARTPQASPLKAEIIFMIMILILIFTIVIVIVFVIILILLLIIIRPP